MLAQPLNDLMNALVNNEQYISYSPASRRLFWLFLAGFLVVPYFFF